MNSQLYYLSENIAMMAISILNVYKDIQGNDTKTIAMTGKNDDFNKIVGDITFNLSYVSEMLGNFKKYNRELFQEMTDGNFHCKTLESDMGNMYNHIDIEYTKYQNDIQKRMEYYVDFSENINQQLDNMKISDFCN